MWIIGLTLIYLAIARSYEPLLLLPIGFGIILVNLPLAGLMTPEEGLLWKFYQYGIHWEIIPPVMKLLTSGKERKIRMAKGRKVGKLEKMLFPIVSTFVIVLLVPASAPLIAMFMLGNLFRESGVVARLHEAAQNELMNIVTIFLGVPVGATMNADNFLRPQVIFVFCLGLAAFVVSTMTGIILAKIMNLFSKNKINPLLGAAGVSAVPMAARVVHKVGMEADKRTICSCMPWVPMWQGSSARWWRQVSF